MKKELFSVTNTDSGLLLCILEDSRNMGCSHYMHRVMKILPNFVNRVEFNRWSLRGLYCAVLGSILVHSPSNESKDALKCKLHQVNLLTMYIPSYGKYFLLTYGPPYRILRDWKSTFSNSAPQFGNPELTISPALSC